MNGESKSNGTGSPAPQRTLESDLALLQSLLSVDENEAGDSDVAELLRRLETANGIASDLEDRLDGIMEGLDDLLGELSQGGADLSVSEETTAVHEGDTPVHEEQERVVRRVEQETEDVPAAAED